MSLIPNVAVVTVIDDDGNTVHHNLTSDKMSFEEGISTSGGLDLNISGNNSLSINVNGQEAISVGSNSLITLNSDLFVKANLIVQGSTTSINVEELAISDNLITLNSGTIGAPVLDAGIEVDRGSDVNAQFLWDETNDRWLVGISGNLDSVVLNNDLVAVSGDLYTQMTNLSETITITTSGDNYVEAGVSGSTLDEIFSSTVDAINTLDTRRAVNYVFTTGQTGAVRPYAETNDLTFTIIAQIAFPGTDFLDVPSLAQVIASAQDGFSGDVRLYDLTNATEIAFATTSGSTMEIIDMIETGSYPTDQAILEVQTRSSQNNKWMRTATLSLRWN